MLIHSHTTVGEVAAARPDTLPIFQELQIDFCCGGKRPLQDALAERGLSVEAFLARADELPPKRLDNAGSPNFTDMSPAVLSCYIEDTHHTYLRRALPEIDRLLLAVLKAHGAHHTELFDVYKLFGQLKTDLNQHLIKEETLLFPALTRSDSPAGAMTAEIVAEHEAAGALLEALRRTAHDYQAPDDGCATYRRVYAMLPELEADLHQHIHLENNILLKGVLP